MGGRTDVLQDLDIGNGVAEREVKTLESFFFESNEWRKLYSGHVDLIFGPKGSGKSTLYLSLLDKEYELSQQNILLVSSENKSGESVFSNLRKSPPKSEDEYIAIWKLYILSLIVQRCHVDGIDLAEIGIVREILEAENIYKKGRTISSFFANVADYVKSKLNFDSVEGEVELDSATGLPRKIKGKFTYSEPPQSVRDKGYISISDALRACNNSLLDENLTIWILVDRLDVIFPNDREAEKLAIRALFRVYSDLFSYPAIKLKIFLRDDIWKTITQNDGFREASHLINKITIRWDKGNIVNLLIIRLLNSTLFRQYYGLGIEFRYETLTNKINFINSLMPRNLTLYGEGKSRPIEWLLLHTRDGQDITTPRDIIELLNFAKEYEINRLLRGENEYRSRNLLFNMEGLSVAGGQLSKLKTEQTIFAEYPDLRAYIEHFFESPTRNFDIDILERVWNVERSEAYQIASRLSDIGFFKMSGRGKYLIPVLYVQYLRINPNRRKKV